MKPIIKKILYWAVGVFAIFVLFTFIADVFIMPWYVDSEEVVVPNLVGQSKEEASKVLIANNLNPVVEGPRYSEDFPIDHIIHQRPEAGTIVKTNRQVHIVYSGGNPLTKMPNLIDKTLRDAKVSIERMGFELGNVSEVKSETEANTIVDQYPKEGANLQKGTKVNLKVSVGPNIGMVRVPELLSLSLREAKELIQQNSLVLGKINYQDSKTLLPNTVVAQYPAKNRLVNIGESIDLFITKNQD